MQMKLHACTDECKYEYEDGEHMYYKLTDDIREEIIKWLQKKTQKLIEQITFYK